MRLLRSEKNAISVILHSTIIHKLIVKNSFSLLYPKNVEWSLLMYWNITKLKLFQN